jgi:hypothetical protein
MQAGPLASGQGAYWAVLLTVSLSAVCLPHFAIKVRLAFFTALLSL